MAISIDRVYQKVLAFANKEQRGYITPQEFNLFADQAQMEILEQYFYDINQFGRTRGNDTEYSDIVSLIQEKLSVLKGYHTTEVFDGVSSNSALINFANLPSDLYKIGTIFSGGVEVEEIQMNELLVRQASPLTRATESRPVYVNIINVEGSGIEFYPSTISSVSMTYIKKTTPHWGYEVVNKKALYSESTTVNFGLHLAEESELVYRILGFAGIAIEKPGLTQAAITLETQKVQQEKQ